MTTHCCTKYLFYFNTFRYEYIAVIDIDEVIAPIKHKNWTELMNEVSVKSKKTVASWNFRNAQYFGEKIDDPSDEIPEYLFMMQHVYRSEKYTNPGMN